MPFQHSHQGWALSLPRIMSAPLDHLNRRANSGARPILAPDPKPVAWTEVEREKGRAGGSGTIETFHTHGTPPAAKQGA